MNIQERYMHGEEQGVCGVCARPAFSGIFLPPMRRRQPAMWTCDDLECAKIAKDTFKMKQEEFERFDDLATGQGGREGGDYLEQIGKTDLATLDAYEWFEFCRRIVAGYRKALKNDLDEYACQRVLPKIIDQNFRRQHGQK